MSLLQFLWLVPIAMACVQAGWIWLMARERIAANPGLRPGYQRIAIGYLIAVSLPWLVIGLGVVAGQVRIGSELLGSWRGNPFVWGALGTLAGRRGTIRLGEHVTWLTLDGGLPGQAPAPAPQRRHFLDELGRWLSAYLSGAIRDQLLLSGAATGRTR